MRVPASLALAAFIGGASGAVLKSSQPKSLEPEKPPQLWQAQGARPKKPAEATKKPAAATKKPAEATKKPPQTLKKTPLVDLAQWTPSQRIWYQYQSADYEWPVKANGFPYKPMTQEEVVRQETAEALVKGAKRLEQVGRDAAEKKERSLARMTEVHAEREGMKQKAKELQESSKEVARMKHLSNVMKVPVSTPVEEEKDETPENAEAPWPRREHVEEVSQTPKSTAPAENALSAEQSRSAVQGEAQAEKPKKVHDWKEETMNAFYRKKCNQMFSRLDTDDDDAVEEEEIYAFFDVTWHDWDPSELTKKFFEEADENHDGKVSKPEWHVYAEESQKTSKGKEERWNPLEHLKKLVNSNPKADMEHNIEQLNGYYKRIATRLFRGIDMDTDDVATADELRAFLNKKFPTKDPAQFTEKVLAEADKDGDSKVTLEEFWSFAAASRKVSKNNSEKWNPLLHIVDTVRRNKVLDTIHIR